MRMSICLYFFVIAVVPEQAVCKTALREYSAVQMRGVSRTSQITAKFANFDQKIANLRLRRKRRNFGVSIVLMSANISQVR